MKRAALLLIAAAVAGALVSGCCPCRHLATGSRDSVRVEVRERVEYVHDTVEVAVPVEVVRQTVRDTVSRLETSVAQSEARITPDGSLLHSLENKDVSFKVDFELPIIHRDSTTYRSFYRTYTVEVPRPLTGWQRFRLRGFWVLLAALLVAWRRPITTLFRRAI